MKISVDNISKGSPCKAVPNQLTGNISVSPEADVRNILSLEVRQKQASNSHWSPPLQNTGISIPTSLWCATDRPGQFIFPFQHSQSAVTSCSYTENQLLFATGHVKYDFKNHTSNSEDGNMKILNARLLLTLVFLVWWASWNSQVEKAVISMVAASKTHPCERDRPDIC